MKKNFLLLQALLLIGLASSAQNVAINTDGSQPATSAMLDIKSNNKGLLIPRMTEVEELAIPSPATGLIVYQTDNAKGLHYYNGSEWKGLWSLEGNELLSGGGGYFLGSTDSSGLAFRTSNTLAMYIDKYGKIGMGNNAFQTDALLHLRNSINARTSLHVDDISATNTLPSVLVANSSSANAVQIRKETSDGDALNIYRKSNNGGYAINAKDSGNSSGHNLHALEIGEGINGYFLNTNTTGSQPNILSQVFGDHTAGEFYKGLSSSSLQPALIVSTASRGPVAYLTNTNKDNTSSLLKVENKATGSNLIQAAIEAISTAGGNGMGGRFTGGYQGMEVNGYLGMEINAASKGIDCFVNDPTTFGTTAINIVTTSNSIGTNIGIHSKPQGSGSFKTTFYGEGNINITGSYFTSSDRKLKQNIQSLSGSLAKLMQLKPLAYQYKTSEYKMGLPEGIQMGFVAQDLQTVFPELVQQQIKPEEKNKKGEVVDPEVKYLGVNYTGLIPVTIAAVQEQQQKIQTLEAENAQLKKDMAAIKVRLGL